MSRYCHRHSNNDVEAILAEKSRRSAHQRHCRPEMHARRNRHIIKQCPVDGNTKKRSKSECRREFTSISRDRSGKQDRQTKKKRSTSTPSARTLSTHDVIEKRSRDYKSHEKHKTGSRRPQQARSSGHSEHQDVSERKERPRDERRREMTYKHRVHNISGVRQHENYNDNNSNNNTCIASKLRRRRELDQPFNQSHDESRDTVRPQSVQYHHHHALSQSPHQVTDSSPHRGHLTSPSVCRASSVTSRIGLQSVRRRNLPRRRPDPRTSPTNVGVQNYVMERNYSNDQPCPPSGSFSCHVINDHPGRQYNHRGSTRSRDRLANSDEVVEQQEKMRQAIKWLSDCSSAKCVGTEAAGTVDMTMEEHIADIMNTWQKDMNSAIQQENKSNVADDNELVLPVDGLAQCLDIYKYNMSDGDELVRMGGSEGDGLLHYDLMSFRQRASRDTSHMKSTRDGKRFRRKAALRNLLKLMQSDDEHHLLSDSDDRDDNQAQMSGTEIKVQLLKPANKSRMKPKSRDELVHLTTSSQTSSKTAGDVTDWVRDSNTLIHQLEDLLIDIGRTVHYNKHLEEKDLFQQIDKELNDAKPPDNIDIYSTRLDTFCKNLDCFIDNEAASVGITCSNRVGNDKRPVLAQRKVLYKTSDVSNTNIM